MLPTTINERWTLLLPEHRHARAEWSYWEKARLAAMHDRIVPGDVVYDIGAEEGDLPCLWATWGASVHLFEPNARVWPNMRVIFDANGHQPGGWFVGFAGDVDDFDKPDYETFGAGSWPLVAQGEPIGDHGFCHLWERPDIPKVTVDSYSQVTGSIPTVLTIDVEGSELRVLKGSEQTLRNHRPTVFVSVHPEFMKQMYDERPDQLMVFMESCGYQGTFLAQDHEHHWRFDA
jgi:FkbM family methyltransferase